MVAGFVLCDGTRCPEHLCHRGLVFTYTRHCCVIVGLALTELGALKGLSLHLDSSMYLQALPQDLRWLTVVFRLRAPS